MKFTIEVEDFWLEEEELTEALSSHIQSEVIHTISASIKEKTEKQITEKIKEVIDKKIELVIDSTLTDLIAVGTIKVYGDEISIVDHIKSIFQEHNRWKDPSSQIKAIAKDFTSELKKQYDMVFANKIVVQMKEQGFLKDDLVQVLLGDKTKGET